MFAMNPASETADDPSVEIEQDSHEESKTSLKRSLDESTQTDALAVINKPIRRKVKQLTAAQQKKQGLENIFTQIESVDIEDEAVYDDCNEVRRKIRNWLAEVGANQSQLPKHLGVQYKQVYDFLARKGPADGAGTVVYPLAYLFFERVRLLNNKQKSNRRLQAEAMFGPCGRPLIQCGPRTKVWGF